MTADIFSPPLFLHIFLIKALMKTRGGLTMLTIFDMEETFTGLHNHTSTCFLLRKYRVPYKEGRLTKGF